MRIFNSDTRKMARIALAIGANFYNLGKITFDSILIESALTPQDREDVFTIPRDQPQTL